MRSTWRPAVRRIDYYDTTYRHLSTACYRAVRYVSVCLCFLVCFFVFSCFFFMCVFCCRCYPRVCCRCMATWAIYSREHPLGAPSRLHPSPLGKAAGRSVPYYPLLRYELPFEKFPTSRTQLVTRSRCRSLPLTLPIQRRSRTRTP